MRATYAKALPLVLSHEGGFVNHPKDPGGATFRGVTQKVYNAYRKNKGLPIQSVKLITPAEIQDIYDNQYWKVVKGDKLPAGIDYAVFDYAVNSGPSKAVKDLQRCLGVGVDGVVGEKTLEALTVEAMNDEEALIVKYCEMRMKFLKGLKTWGTFGKGWKRRVMGDKEGFQIGDHGVIDYAIMIARDDLQYPIPKTLLPSAIGTKKGEVLGKSSEADQSKIKTKEGLGAAISASGITSQTVMTAAEQIKPNINDTMFGKLALVAFALVSAVGAALFLWGMWQRYKEKAG